MNEIVITDKHRQILAKAELLFAEKGFDGATVRDIAEAAGVNLAMISYYFGSKEKLMEALFRERMIAMRMRLESLIQNTSLSPFQKLEVLIDDYISKILEKQCFYRIMLSEQLVNKNSVVLKLLNELKLSNAKLIQTLIKEGQEKKVFREDVDIMLLVNTMSGTVMQSLIGKEYYRNFNDLKKMKADALDALLAERLRKHVKHLFKAILENES